jgi:hypothetical protein
VAPSNNVTNLSTHCIVTNFVWVTVLQNLQCVLRQCRRLTN